jgi:hypothetical protein
MSRFCECETLLAERVEWSHPAVEGSCAGVLAVFKIKIM